MVTVAVTDEEGNPVLVTVAVTDDEGNPVLDDEGNAVTKEVAVTEEVPVTEEVEVTEVVVGSFVPPPKVIPDVQRVDIDPMKAPEAEFGSDDAGNTISITVKTDGFTKGELDSYGLSFTEQLGDIGRYKIGGEIYSEDQVNITVTREETGDPETPYRLVAEITLIDPDGDFGIVSGIDYTPITPPTIAGEVDPPVLPPVFSPLVGG